MQILDKVRASAAVPAFIFFVYSIVLAVQGWDSKWPRSFDIRNHKIQQVIVWCLWTILPPVYFIIEYFIFLLKKEKRFNNFKYGQEVASKIWIAIATIVFALYFGKDIRGNPPPTSASDPPTIQQKN